MSEAPKLDRLTVGVIHDYILAFGLTSLNFVYLESRLRDCLLGMARVRSKWPITMKRWNATQALHQETTLGGLVTEFERQAGAKGRELVANLRPLVKDRNEMLHKVVPIADVQRKRMPLDVVMARTKKLNELAKKVQGRMHAVLKFHHPIHVEIGRLLDEHHGGSGSKDILARYAAMVRDLPEA